MISYAVATIIAVAALFLGALIAHFVTRSGFAGRLSQAETLLAERQARLEELRAELAQADQQTEQLRQRLSERDTAVSRLETNLEAEKSRSEEKVKLLDEAREKLADAFKAVGSKVLEDNSRSFLERALKELELVRKESSSDLEKRQQAVDEMVKPIRESLDKVQSQIQQVEKSREGAYQGLFEQVKALQEANLQLKQETNSLSRALSKTSTQGQWGEMQLRRVVEFAGMVNHVDFVEQQTSGDQRPDMIVKLPGGKRIVVDAKAPLDAFLEAQRAEDEKLRHQWLRDHASKVKSHIIQLGRKGYWNQFDTTPEFVVMFLPSEAFFSAALGEQPDLIEIGAEQKVIPATPTTLIALLKAVAYGWKQEEVAANAREIAAQGRELHERIGKMAEYVLRIGKGLDSAVSSYNSAVGNIETRVLPAARRFQDLGAGSDKDLGELTPVEPPSRNFSAPEITEQLGLEPGDEEEQQS